MKVVCETCNTRYAISDEKVRGKSVKIKCKKCGTFMVVRAAGVAEAETGKAEELPAEPALVSSAGAGGSRLASEAVVEGAAGAAESPVEKETRVFNYAEFEQLMANKAEESTPAAVIPSAPRAASGTPEWYLLVAEEQLGPLRASDVEERILKGEVDGETLVWREGLGDWMALRDIGELAPLLSGSAAAHMPDLAEPTRLEPAPLGSVLGAPGGAPDLLGATGPGNGSRPAASPRQTPPPVTASPSLGIPDFSPPAESGEKKLTGQRHEDSVLFSLKNLGVVSFQDGKDAPKVVETPSAPVRPAPLEPMSVGAGMGRIDVPLPPPIVMPPARTGLSSGAKMAIGASALVAVGAIVAVVFVVTRDSPAPPPVVVAPPAPAPAPSASPAPAPVPGPAVAAKPAPAAPVPVGVSPAPAPAPVPAPVAAAPAKQDDEEEEVVVRGKKKKVKRKKKGVVVASASSAPRSSAAAPVATAEPAPDPAPTREPVREPPRPDPDPPPSRRPVVPKAPDHEIKAILEGAPPRAAESRPEKPAPREESLPETLEKSQVHGVIRRAMGSIVKCYNSKVSDKSSTKGTLNVSFTIRGNGRTSGIRVQRPDYWGSDFVGCVGNAVSRWKFPKFKGEEIEITYPFILGGF